MEVNEPIIVVEVVSPSSRGIDSGAKLVAYFSLPTVRHYLIMDTDKRSLSIIAVTGTARSEFGPARRPGFARSARV